jgi:hypothetical protein
MRALYRVFTLSKLSAGLGYTTHNKYFKEFGELTVSVEKALAYFATHPETVLGLFGCYCEESGLELKQVA